MAFVAVVAFFYDVGKSGGDFLLKENYRVPYKEDEFKTLKRMKEYVR